MDKKLSYVNTLLMWWGSYIRSGMTCQGVYRTSEWASGKPVEPCKKPRVRAKRPKPLTPYSQPHESRTTRPTVPCLRHDEQSEIIHKAVVRLPESYKPVICYIYVRGMSYRDISECLGMTSRQIGNTRNKVLKAISNVL